MPSARPRLIAFAGAALLLALLALWFFPRRPAPAVAPATASSASAPKSTTPVPAPSRAAESDTPASKIEPPSGESTLAADLNAPAGTVQRDLAILQEVFTAWLTNFPRLGHPGGENRDITAALCGENPVRFAFIPRTHRAINAAGELCDRWGTPFRFHQLSGQHMELRSAGPDRRFGTPDDAVLTPEGAPVL